MYTTKSQLHLSRIHAILMVSILSVFAMPTTASAQQWQFEPIMSLFAEQNDNLRLDVDEQTKIDDTALILDLNGRFVRRTQTSEVRIAPRVRSRNYADESAADSNDAFFDFFAQNETERSVYGIQTRYGLESILTAEINDPDFDNPDVNNPVNLDTGRIQVDSDRETIIVAPYFAHRFTETIGFGFSAEYIDVNYDSNQTSLANFSSLSGGPSINFRLSERTSWSVRLVGVDYESSGATVFSESQSTGATIEFQHQLSSTLDLRAGAGYKNIDSDVTSGGTTTTDSDSATLFSAGLTKSGEISRLIIEASQAVDPSGSGFLQKRAQLRVGFTRQLSPRVYGNFEARIQNTQELAALQADIERDFERFQIGVEWRVAQKWSVLANYAFTTQEYSNEADEADSNVFSIGVVYQPHRLR